MGQNPRVAKSNMYSSSKIFAVPFRFNFFVTLGVSEKLKIPKSSNSGFSRRVDSRLFILRFWIYEALAFLCFWGSLCGKIKTAMPHNWNCWYAALIFSPVLVCQTFFTFQWLLTLKKILDSRFKYKINIMQAYSNRIFLGSTSIISYAGFK